MSTLQQVSELRAAIGDVDAQIAAARSGASYSIGGRTLTRQSLPDLQMERQRLVRELKQAEAVLEGARNPGVAIASWHR